MFKYNNLLSINDFINVTDRIVKGYFTEEREYVPHLGLIKAMLIYWNYCITDSPYQDAIKDNVETSKEETIDISVYNNVFADEEFSRIFNESVNETNCNLSFGCAYKCALQMVEAIKLENNSVKSIIEGVVNSLADKFQNILTDENVNYLATIADKINNGEVSADAIVNAYGEKVGFMAGKQDDK